MKNTRNANIRQQCEKEQSTRFNKLNLLNLSHFTRKQLYNHATNGLFYLLHAKIKFKGHQIVFLMKYYFLLNIITLLKVEKSRYRNSWKIFEVSRNFYN